MSPKEIPKQIFDSTRRVERATQFLVQLTDMLEGRLDPFERSLSRTIIDEFISIYADLNKRGK
jgi:hypothetical protein